MSIGLLGAVGLAVDVGNMYVTHNRLQSAVDAAALAGSLELPYDPSVSNGTVASAVATMLDTNLNVADVDSVTAGTEARSVCVEASTTVDFMFLGAAGRLLGVSGLESKSLSASACAGFNNLEVALVIDNTGSMKGTPIDRVKQASRDLVDLILPDGGAPSTKIGLVPFRGKVRVANNVDGLPGGCRNADGTLNTGLPEIYWYTYGAKPSGKSISGGEIVSLEPKNECSFCQEVMGGGLMNVSGSKVSGSGSKSPSPAPSPSPTPASSSNVGIDGGKVSKDGSVSKDGDVSSDPYTSTDGKDSGVSDPLAKDPSGSSTGTTDPLSKSKDGYTYLPPMISDTCSCIPVIQPLTTDKYDIVSAINSQSALGSGSGTVISEGVKWGAKVLSPESPYTEGGASEDYRKVMILLTDGDTEDGNCGGQYAVGYTPNNYWTNAYYGMEVDTCHCEDGGCLNTALLNEAQAAKDQGIEIFAIRFGYSDSTDVELMKSIASSKPGTNDHYYNAPTAEDIPEIFKQIGRQLGWRLLN